MIFLLMYVKYGKVNHEKLVKYGIRNVQIRTGLVLSLEDGALKQMLPPFKFFIGGPLGNGKQWSSWLHIDDIVGIYLHAIDNKNLSGAVNAAAPNPVRMKEFAKTLGKVFASSINFSRSKICFEDCRGRSSRGCNCKSKSRCPENSSIVDTNLNFLIYITHFRIF